MGKRVEIMDALEARVALVTKANGYTQDIQTVTSEEIKINIAEYKDFELPAAQLIDLTQIYKHEQSRSKTSWAIALELCMRTTETLGVVNQRTLWNFQEDVIRSIMAVPGLGVSGVQHVKLLDAITDLHLHHPNYIATIGLDVLFYEPITQDNC